MPRRRRESSECSYSPLLSKRCSMLTGLSIPVQVHQILFVLAVIFEHIGVREKFVRNFHGEGFGVHFRIVEGHFVIQVSEIPATETFQRAQGLTMWVAHAIERGLVIKTGGLHNQRVALPVPG